MDRAVIRECKFNYVYCVRICGWRKELMVVLEGILKEVEIRGLQSSN